MSTDGAAAAAPRYPKRARVERLGGQTLACRPRLTSCSTLEQAVTALRRSKRIVVLVGAGISVSCGIPDFRSEGGLYAMAAELGLDLASVQDIFNVDAFDCDPQPFYSFAHALWPRPGVRPSLTHRFLVALARQKKLLRVYTQNIDGLERAAGLPARLLVECHGSLRTARCRGCRQVCDAAALAADVSARAVPRCPCGGVWKPEVTFFGEPLPARVGHLLAADRDGAKPALRSQPPNPCSGSRNTYYCGISL
jgi:NAD-dependent SIR2 family protein deacetylase